MNDLSEAYSIYPSADKILELINTNKNGYIKRSTLKKTAYWNTTLSLLTTYKFISIKEIGKHQLLLITEEGIQHLKNGGFGQNLIPPPKEETKKTFKQHLDDLTGLITIFGILNAVILFSTQVKNPNPSDPLDLNATGVQFISISMYLLSLVVLWEIIWTTLKEMPESFKFKALYFLLCTTTIGIGSLFLNQYYELFYGLGFLLIFFVVTLAVQWLILKIFLLFFNKNNSTWLVKHSKNLSFILSIISVFASGFILILVIKLIKYLL